MYESSFHRPDREEQWNREMKKYGIMYKRLSTKLNSVSEQNQRVQNGVNRIIEHPNQHTTELQLLLYLEEKKRV